MNTKLELDQKRDRLNRLRGYLDADPNNLALLADGVTQAYDAKIPETSLELLNRYEAIQPLTPPLLNLKGMALLQTEQFAAAVEIFENLYRQAPSEPALRFNLAWAKTMTGDDAGAAELLDEATTAAIDGAPKLKVQALHRLGELEAALECGRVLAERHPEDSSLMGALSLVAIDLQMPELAQAWAARAEDTDEGLSSLGILVMQDNNIEAAISYFDRGIALRPDSARNLLGKGLALLAAGDAPNAVGYLDRSAEIFGTHLGTWIGSGWAHFTLGDLTKARQIFEHAMALDDTFAETHGALAVLDFQDGLIDSARRRTETALRLDRKCFAGALAKTLLLEHDGDLDAARRVRDITLNTPLESGRTIADAMVAFAPNLHHRRK
jgi:tetratricopeptide (TPR) repeat protein